MSWIRRLLGRSPVVPPERDPGTRSGSTRDASEGTPGEGNGGPDLVEGSLDSDGAEPEDRPIDLRANLDAGLAACPEALRRSLGEELMAFAVRAERSLERPFLVELARRVREGDLRLPPMPEAVLRVQRLLDSPSCNVADLAREIEVDPSLTTRLVGIANSPFYQVLGPVQSLGDAVVRIGLGETRNIVLAVTLRSRVFRVPGREADTSRLWQHSVAASISAQSLAACVGQDPDVAFLVGLLHDLGRVVLLSMSAEIERSLRAPQPISPELLSQLDADLHAPLGGLAAESWRIAPELVEAIVHHHQQPGRTPLGCVAHCADLMAHRIAPVEGAPTVASDRFEAALEALGLDLESAADVEQDARDVMEARGKRL